jgi:hypothetical protein
VLLIASVVLGPAALIPFSMGVTLLRRDYRLAHDGAMVEGKVDGFEEVRYSTSQPGSHGVFSSGGGSKSVIRVNYSFRTADEVAHHDSQTALPEFVKGLSVGGPVRVRYVRSDPEISEIRSQPALNGYLFTAIGTVSLALVIGVFVAGLRQVGSGAGRGFSECTATVTEVEDADYIVDSERYLRVRFQFSDAAGIDHWGKSPPLAPAEARAHAVGSRVRIRYNPREPSITRWLE